MYFIAPPWLIGFHDWDLRFPLQLLAGFVGIQHYFQQFLKASDLFEKVISFHVIHFSENTEHTNRKDLILNAHNF